MLSQLNIRERSFKQVWLCGDDVDILAPDALYAAQLLTVAKHQWAINASKQIFSSSVHEFLQKEPSVTVAYDL